MIDRRTLLYFEAAITKAYEDKTDLIEFLSMILAGLEGDAGLPVLMLRAKGISVTELRLMLTGALSALLFYKLKGDPTKDIEAKPLIRPSDSELLILIQVIEHLLEIKRPVADLFFYGDAVIRELLHDLDPNVDIEQMPTPPTGIEKLRQLTETVDPEKRREVSLMLAGLSYAFTKFHQRLKEQEGAG